MINFMLYKFYFKLKKEVYTVLGFLHSTVLCPENIPDNKVPKNIGYNIRNILMYMPKL